LAFASCLVLLPLNTNNNMEQTTQQAPPSPEGIMQIGMGFWASKILLTAIKFELFTILGEKHSLSAAEIRQVLKLHCSDRHLYDFLDALTVFGFLDRSGIWHEARYTNGLGAGIFLNKKKPSYIGGILELANSRLYRTWDKLEEGLLTGLSQSDVSTGPEHTFDGLYADPERLKLFMDAMSGINMGNFNAFAQKFDFSAYNTLTDAGGAGAQLSIAVAKHQPHMYCTSFDLPIVEPIALQNIREAGVAARVQAAGGDFFTGDIPPADIIVMANIMHDWGEEKKLLLMEKAYEALPDNGVFVAIENVIDDERKKNAFGMMMSLNMLIQTGKGFDYTFTDFNGWAKKIGFSRTMKIPLAGPSSAVVAYK